MLIACATDRRYVEMTGVLIRSICAQSHKDRPEIVVFCADVRKKDKEKMAACATPDASISLPDIDPAVYGEIRDLPVKRHLSVTAYLSIYIPYLLRDKPGRMLYLDSDIVVNASLDPLFDVAMQGRSAAAVQDAASPERLRQWNEAIGHAPDEPYFNSGIFLVDLAEWNRREVTQRGAHYAKNRPGPVLQHDQAVLNHALRGDWTPLDPVWNAKPTELPVEDARVMPIQHFRGRTKPFYSDYPREYRTVYDRFRAQTPWANARRLRPISRSLDKRRREITERIDEIRSFFKHDRSDA